MLTDLVAVTTHDGITLTGAYFAPDAVAQPPSVDAVLFLHGDTGHFYAGLYLELGQRMAEHGIAFLTGNRRGHDHVANGVRGGPLAGYAFESVDDARADFAAWLELLRERGHRRIAIGGHSGGAVRAAYAQATERFDNVVAVMPVSPGEYNHEGVVALHGEDFAGPFRDSEQNVAEGRPDVLIRPGVPWGSTWSARAYVDCFNQDNRYSVTRHAAEHRLPHALHLRRRGVRRRRPPRAPRMRRSPPKRRSRRIPPRPATRNRRSRPRLRMAREQELFNTMLAWLSAL